MNRTTMAVLLLVMVQTTWAAEGVLEINQTCALNGGCFPGDAPGFPVEITQYGSYILTSNLDLSAFPNTGGISITADGTSLNLGGFSIVGDIMCSGSGPTLSCPSDGAIGVAAFATGVSISNGTIRNMSRFGLIVSGESARISDLFLRHNGSGGLNLGENAIVHRVIAQENDSNGIDAASSSVVQHSVAMGNSGDGINLGGEVVIDHSTSRNNGGRGFNIGPRSRFGSNNQSRLNVDTDQCGLGECTHLRRYYLTSNTFLGNQVLLACFGSFRPASIYELYEFNHMHYDRVLANTAFDPVGGPPNMNVTRGWAYQNQTVDGLSCLNWSSDSSSDQGMALRLYNPLNWDSAPIVGQPWTQLASPCDVNRPVWCIEDK